MKAFVFPGQGAQYQGMAIPLLERGSAAKTWFEQANDILGMDITFLITPQTPDQRIRHIDAVSNSFIYMVSSNAITGAKGDIDQEQVDYFKRIEDMGLKKQIEPHTIGESNLTAGLDGGSICEGIAIRHTDLNQVCPCFTQ